MGNMIINLGIFLSAAAVISLILKYLKQSAILAYIITGMLISFFYKTRIFIPDNILDLSTDIGIILLMFMAGLRFNYKAFHKRWKLLVVKGLSLTIINTMIGIVIGLVFLDLTKTTALIYFGLILSFFSTTIVVNYLNLKKETDSFHGQILLGLMALQNFIVVISITVLSSISSGDLFFPSLGFLIIKIVVMGLVLGLMSKYIFKYLFRLAAESVEILFISSIGLVMGVAALSEVIELSPVIGVFLLGISLSDLTYKLEIEDKIESLKDFGLVIFFIVLGYKLDFTYLTTSIFLPIIIIVIFNLIVIPIISFILGSFVKLKRRPAFMIGSVINQMSEFSLIVVTLAYNTGIFNQKTFFIIILSAVLSMFLSSYIHNFLSEIYLLIFNKIKFHERNIKNQPKIGDTDLNEHIIIIGYNEITDKVLKRYINTDQNVIVLDLDPENVENLKDKYKNVKSLYLDIFDPDTREIAAFNKAKLIISSYVKAQPAEIGILNWLKEQKAEVPFIVTSDSKKDSIELYNAGAAYVIQIKDLASEHLDLLIENTNNNYSKIFDYGNLHRKSLL